MGDGTQTINMTEVNIENGTDNPAYIAAAGDAEKNGKPPSQTKFTKTLSDVKNKRGKKPMWLCRVIVERPKTAFGITLTFHILFLLITGIMLYFEYNIFPTEFTDLPLDIRKEEQFKLGIAWDERDANFNRVNRFENTIVKVGIRTVIYDSLEIIFFKEGDNVFTKENLKTIQKFQSNITDIKDYNKYCLLNDQSDRSCVPPFSIIQFFDGTYADTFGDIFYDPEFENISSVLNAAWEIPQLQESLNFFLSENAVINENETSSEQTRILIDFGSPLDNLTEGIKFEDERSEEIDDYIRGDLMDFLHDVFENGLGGDLEVTYISLSIFEEVVNSTVFNDLILIVGSFFFIFIFIYFQTRSWWITGFSVFSIITSFLFANLFYRVVLGYEFFGIFHVLAIFILLGIGADDVFIFVDTWRATALLSYPSLAHRLSDTYRRAATAMFVTSLTTAAAFFVNFFSPFFATSSFGVFSTLMIIANYLSVITYFPTVLITYHTIWKDCRCCCCKCCYPDDDDAPKRPNVIVRFFAGPFYKFVTHKVVRWVIVVVLLGVTAAFSYLISTIESQERDVQIFPSSHHIQLHNDRRTNFRRSVDGDDNIEVHLVFGLETVDLSICSFNDYQCYGNTIYDDTFDMNSPEIQQAFLDFCTRLRDLDESKTDELWIRRSGVTGKPELVCFVEDMKAYFEDDERNISFPLTLNSTKELVSNNPDIYNNTVLKTGDRAFEIGLAYWLTDGHKEIPDNDHTMFDYYLGEEETNNSFKTVRDEMVNTRLKYAAIVINTTMIWGDFGYTTGLPLLEKWDEFIKEQMALLPEGINKAYQCTPAGANYNFWLWMKIQEELVNSAIRNIAIGISVAFVVLVLTTQNIIIGTLATITICCITACVLGLIPVLGWTLGTLESLNLSLVVGLSVDYVVHLAEGYYLAESKDRMGKTKEMLEAVGVSILSGCITTLGACFFMLFSVIIFFLQFGTFVFCTIGLSYIFAMFLFPALISFIGPENNCGSLRALFCCFCSKK